MVEKPFGRDLASARALDARLRRHYPEDRVFRVDHFLGKEPVEDLLVLRFANTLLESLWNRQWIDHFEITMAEDFDVADRGSFYDAVGTVRDVVQNHLLQVLAYLLMEPPLTTAADDQRDAKHRLLRAVRTVDPAEVVRGRYDGYLATPGVAPESTTETYVALTLHVDDWRWAGVPVHIRAGKALPTTLLDVVAVLRPPPRALFPGPHGTAAGRPGPPAAAARRRRHLHAAGQAARGGRRAGARSRRRRLPAGARAPCTPPTSGSSPTRCAATRRTSPAWTTSNRRGASSVRSSTHAPRPTRTRRGSWGPAAAATLPGPQGWVELPTPARSDR